jgi:hypothetical protein
MTRTWLFAGLLLVVGTGLWGLVARRTDAPASATARSSVSRDLALRERLSADLQPVRLANCTLERFGEPNDGGYLMCANLLDVQAGYSYGINNYDGWGCRIATRVGIPVHQYDCFDQRVPTCDTGETHFHPECIAGTAFTDADGRPFDTLASQVARNGHAGQRLVVKIDVEGAEWDSLLETPREVLERIDQLAIEFHAMDRDTWKHFLLVSKLKEVFHVAHLHFNNHACEPGLEPFPAFAYEALLVNKRIAALAPNQSPVLRPHALDAPANPDVPDCQYVADGPGARPR